jgi:hypothetical protein
MSSEDTLANENSHNCHVWRGEREEKDSSSELAEDKCDGSLLFNSTPKSGTMVEVNSSDSGEESVSELPAKHPEIVPDPQINSSSKESLVGASEFALCNTTDDNVDLQNDLGEIVDARKKFSSDNVTTINVALSEHEVTSGGPEEIQTDGTMSVLDRASVQSHIDEDAQHSKNSLVGEVPVPGAVGEVIGADEASSLHLCSGMEKEITTDIQNQPVGNLPYVSEQVLSSKADPKQASNSELSNSHKDAETCHSPAVQSAVPESPEVCKPLVVQCSVSSLLSMEIDCRENIPEETVRESVHSFSECPVTIHSSNLEGNSSDRLLPQSSQMRVTHEDVKGSSQSLFTTLTLLPAEHRHKMEDFSSPAGSLAVKSSEPSPSGDSAAYWALPKKRILLRYLHAGKTFFPLG